MLVRQPGQLRGELVLLAIRGDDRHRETVVEGAGKHAFDPADYDRYTAITFSPGSPTLCRSGTQRSPATCRPLSGVLGLVLKHEARVNLHADALKVPPLSTGRRNVDRC